MKLVLRRAEHHNPECNIIEIHLNRDEYLAYRESLDPKKPASIEYYRGKNYCSASTKRSYSRYYEFSKAPKWMLTPFGYPINYQELLHKALETNPL